MKVFGVPLVPGVVPCFQEISVQPTEQLFYQHLQCSCHSKSCTSPALLESEATPVLELAGRSTTNDFSLFPSRQFLFIFVVVVEVNI